MTAFQWKNCYADVVSSHYPITVRSFLGNVITPAVRALEAQIATLARSDYGGDVFALADEEEVLRATMMAFGLSVQSIWERQLRRYLSGCAQELRPGEALAERAMTSRWDKIGALFHELRGISLEAFPSYATLDTLHLLGNACRHGDGRSALELWKRCPDLWPQYGQNGLVCVEGSPPVEMMLIPLSRLEEFVEAIIIFWDDAEFIYLESLERKHPSVIAKLESMRRARSSRPPVVMSPTHVHRMDAS